METPFRIVRLFPKHCHPKHPQNPQIKKRGPQMSTADPFGLLWSPLHRCRLLNIQRARRKKRAIVDGLPSTRKTWRHMQLRVAKNIVAIPSFAIRWLRCRSLAKAGLCLVYAMAIVTVVGPLAL